MLKQTVYIKMKKLIILSIVVVVFGCSDVMGQSGSRKVIPDSSGVLSAPVFDKEWDTVRVNILYSIEDKKISGNRPVYYSKAWKVMKRVWKKEEWIGENIIQEHWGYVPDHYLTYSKKQIPIEWIIWQIKDEPFIIISL